jgi:transcriptional regulator with XRE-family HTH domain
MIVIKYNYANKRTCLTAERRKKDMAGEFGAYINDKRKGRAPNGGDVLLRDLAKAMGNMSVSYLSDIIKGRRNPPDKKLLDIIAEVLSLSAEEKAEMYDLAGRERDEAAPDLPDYIMDENIPHVRAALRKANNKGLGDEFWKKVYDEIDKKE